jgi:hypothetical protein
VNNPSAGQVLYACPRQPMRQGSYATGTRNLYTWITDSANTGTGWLQVSSWQL